MIFHNITIAKAGVVAGIPSIAVFVSSAENEDSPARVHCEYVGGRDGLDRWASTYTAQCKDGAVRYPNGLRCTEDAMRHEIAFATRFEVALPGHETAGASYSLPRVFTDQLEYALETYTGSNVRAERSAACA